MLMYGLTDTSKILKLKVVRMMREDTEKMVIVKGVVLDSENNIFSKEYSPQLDGILITTTITEDPKEIFDKISSVKTKLETEEIAFMKNLFLTQEYNTEFIDNTIPDRLKNSGDDSSYE